MCESGELQQPAPQAHCRHALLQSGVAWVLGSEIIYDSVCSYATMSSAASMWGRYVGYVGTPFNFGGVCFLM